MLSGVYPESFSKVDLHLYFYGARKCVTAHTVSLKILSTFGVLKLRKIIQFW